MRVKKNQEDIRNFDDNSLICTICKGEIKRDTGYSLVPKNDRKLIKYNHGRYILIDICDKCIEKIFKMKEVDMYEN